MGVWSTVESCCSVIAACLPTMRPLLTRAKGHTSNTKSTSTKSSKDIKFATSRSKGGPLWSPPPPSSPRKAPYQNLDEYFPDLENGDSTLEMKTSPQAGQNARFETHENFAKPSATFGHAGSTASILRPERSAKDNVPIALLEPRYIGPARI